MKMPISEEEFHERHRRAHRLNVLRFWIRDRKKENALVERAIEIAEQEYVALASEARKSYEEEELENKGVRKMNENSRLG